VVIVSPSIVIGAFDILEAVKEELVELSLLKFSFWPSPEWPSDEEERRLEDTDSLQPPWPSRESSWELWVS
jgi:hypothetical protein